MYMCFPLENQIVAHLFLPEIEVPLSHIPNEELAAVILFKAQDLSEIVCGGGIFLLID